MVHDAAYARGSDLDAADSLFVRENLFSGPSRTLAATAVAAQLLYNRLSGARINMPKKNLRGTTAANAPRTKQTAPKSSPNPSTVTTVPASYGFTLKMRQPIIKRSGNKSTIVGSDFAGSVRTANTSNYQPAASVILNPAYFQNAMLGSQARAFEKFRFTKAVIHYIPSVPTSIQGQLVMCSSRSIKEPFFDGSSTTFLSKALSQGNAVASPLWKETSLEVACSGEWSIVDALIDGDLDDAIQEEVQCYTTCDSTLTAGILMLHYEVEFKDPLYTYHPTFIPVPMGNGNFGTLYDNSAINAPNDTIRLSGAIGLQFSGAAGSIYRLVFRQEASILPVPLVSWANLAAVQQTAAVNTTSTYTDTVAIAMHTGTTLYGVYSAGELVLYASLDGAITGNVNEALVYRAATTVVGTYAFTAIMVRLPSSNRISSN